MIIKCPNCGAPCQVDIEELPLKICNRKEYECGDCKHIFATGWYTDSELRTRTLWRITPTKEK